MWMFLATAGLQTIEKNSEPSDVELITRYQTQADSHCIWMLLQRHKAYLCAVYVRFCPDTVSTQESMHEVFLLLCQKLKHVATADLQHVRGYLRTIVRNHLIDTIRRKKRHQTWESQQSVTAEWYLSLMDERMDRSAMLHAIQEILNEKEWDCVDRFYLQHYSYKEIADQTGMTFNQVRGILHRAIHKLRDTFTTND